MSKTDIFNHQINFRFVYFSLPEIVSLYDTKCRAGSGNK